MLTKTEIDTYKDVGAIVIEGVLDDVTRQHMNKVLADLVERSRAIKTHDAVYDLEPGHSSVEPRVRHDDGKLSGLRVCLDPGHHSDSGAIGPRGFEERESNLLISREVARLLKEGGAEVSFTREEDPMPLKQRHERMRRHCHTHSANASKAATTSHARTSGAFD